MTAQVPASQWAAIRYSGTWSKANYDEHLGSAAAALLWWPRDAVFAAVMAALALSTVPVRQILMPAINRATDAGLRQRFKWLHGLSVVVTLGHIAATGWLLAKLA